MKSNELLNLFMLVRDRKLDPEQALKVARGKASLSECLTTGEKNQAEAPAAQLKVADWNGRNKSAFLQIIEQLLCPAIGKMEVVLHAPHGCRPVPLVNDDRFHLWFWSSPTNNGTCVPSTLWGIGVDARNEGYRPSGLGTAIIDSGGWPVGELVNDNFFIHWDCCETGSKQELAIFTQMMEALALVISANKDKK